MTNFKTRIQTKIDTLAAWNSSNPVLLLGEIVVATDCNSGDYFDTRLKIGDGATAFQSLPFLDESCYELLSEIYKEFYMYDEAIAELQKKVDTSAVVWIGNGVPTNDIGSDNDIYIDASAE